MLGYKERAGNYLGLHRNHQEFILLTLVVCDYFAYYEKQIGYGSNSHIGRD